MTEYVVGKQVLEDFNSQFKNTKKELVEGLKIAKGVLIYERMENLPTPNLAWQKHNYEYE